MSVFRCLYQVLTFTLSYAIPLIIVGVLLGVTLLHWLCSRNVSPQSATSAAAASAADSSTSPAAENVGRHATRVVVVVVVVFAILELPLQVGLPDLPYVTGDPVFQTLSPASRGEAAGKNKSPVFC